MNDKNKTEHQSMTDVAVYDECDFDPAAATLVSCGVCAWGDIFVYPCGHVSDGITGNPICIKDQPRTRGGVRVMLCDTCTYFCETLLTGGEALDVDAVRRAIERLHDFDERRLSGTMGDDDRAFVLRAYLQELEKGRRPHSQTSSREEGALMSDTMSGRSPVGGRGS